MSDVQSSPKQINPGKETSEALEALSGIFADIRAKKPVQEIAMGNLQKLYIAVEGADKIDDEIKSDLRNDTAAYGVKVILDGLLPTNTQQA